ncbi:hypothetical protein BR63_19135 [Thermanaerosceptrum fracticalcis]|uniref:Uncharacterized protein n=2 Tax=Thermanaerosceptrum fracticalcis TaxID=1712410 RepID=A0A7G6E8W1_THEFR|nr:hypothetical protein BR63_19135 [Thermanaerosceptrum fracticalcis]
MPDNISVKPTPIQRNPLDVATELTQLYFSRQPFDTVEDIQNAFLQFYSVAEFAEKTSLKYMANYTPEQLKEIIEKIYR